MNGLNRFRCTRASVLTFLAISLAFSGSIPSIGFAQDQVDSQTVDSESAIDATPDRTTDEQILARIVGIYSQLDALSNVDVAVQVGIVTLTGEASNQTQAQRAVDLATRVDGVVTVEDNIDRVLDVQGNLVPILDQFQLDIARWARSAPLIALALLLFLAIAYAGHKLASWPSLWSRITPNPFVAELVSQAVRVTAVVLGLVIALSMIGATTLMGTILGSAGLVGLTVGFAVRDTVENYVSSIMLSLRQPFRANDHVVINDHEGKVVRLTSRATVLITLDGNHLRIPNSVVYKAIILNYTRNPERRFDFELGIDADDDPIGAMQTGLDAIDALDFVLEAPKPDALIKAVGDSNILITFTGWINQQHSDFQKARSLAIRAAKMALESEGFTLPEPIYRLRFDQRIPQLSDHPEPGQHSTSPEPIAISKRNPDDHTDHQALDVSPDGYLESKVKDERNQASETDLLDGEKPVE